LLRPKSSELAKGVARAGQLGGAKLALLGVGVGVYAFNLGCLGICT
jgi:hypothetical protein